MAVDAAELSTFGGIATVSILHSFIPTHWLPFSVVGRAQKWTITQTLLVSESPGSEFMYQQCLYEGLASQRKVENGLAADGKLFTGLLLVESFRCECSVRFQLFRMQTTMS